jgi:ribosome-binding factor A
MARESRRMQKVNALLESELGRLLVSHIEFPKGAVVSITHVKVSKDLRHARVTISVLPEDRREKALARLEEKRRELEDDLHDRLVMKFTPRLHFRLDTAMERAAHIEGILDSIKKEE